MGDSGGPLFDPVDGVLHGVTSWGSPDCGTKPSVFAKVAAHAQWIRSNAF